MELHTIMLISIGLAMDTFEHSQKQWNLDFTIG